MRFASFPRLIAAALFGLLFAGPALADTPPSLDGTKLVSADDVQKLQASGATVIDVRVASEYAEGHIKGAISVPYREKSDKAVTFDASQDEFNLAKFPPAKDAEIVVYCNGPECWKSYKASTLAVKGGYTKIYWYREGFPNWKSKGLPSE
jgi:rhodanese-related sulfurtransferase